MNIVGEPFDDFVKGQISQRQSKLSKGSYSGADLVERNASTAFLRLASSVNLTNNGALKSNLQRVIDRTGIPASTLTGENLAKNLILFGGASKYSESSTGDNGSIRLNSGLNRGLGNALTGAYGYASSANNRGLVPMPTIESATITYLNRGALRKAEIKIKAFNSTQLYLIDLLYMRPGYSILLEYGHTIYFDNNGGFGKWDGYTTVPLTNFMEGKVNQYELLENIRKERSNRSSNYDAFFGKITTFNYSYNNGEYDITVSAVGQGDVIDSLHIGFGATSEPNTTQDAAQESEPQPVIANKDRSKLNSELHRVYIENANKPLGYGETYTVSGVSTYEDPSQTTTYEFPKGVFVIPEYNTADGGEETHPQVYMKLGALLCYIQAQLMLYDDTKQGTPYIVFDIDYSSDLSNDQNYCLSCPLQVSTDPSVCLIAQQSDGGYGLNSTISDSDIIKRLQDSGFSAGSNAGKLFNIYVNIDHVASVLGDISAGTEDNRVPLIDFLETILSDISKCLGGQNNFTVVYDDDYNRIKVIDESNFTIVPQPESLTKAPSVININGVKSDNASFVESVGMTCELSNNFSTMIAIGASANASQLSENATAFSNFNAGLEDRIVKNKSNRVFTETPTPQLVATVQEEPILTGTFRNLDKQLSIIYNDKQFDMTAINNAKNINSEFVKLMLGEEQKKGKTAAPFFLPFNLQLTMKGISGIKNYQRFKVSEDIIPPSYDRGTFDFIIRGVNHDISGNRWTTSIDSIAVPSNKVS